MTQTIVTEASQAALMQFILNEVGKTHETAKAYIDSVSSGDVDALRDELMLLIGTNGDNITAFNAAMEAIRVAVDAADQNEDGVLDLASTIQALFGKTSLNESNISALSTSVGNIETALNTEVANRVAQGATLSQSITDAIASFNSGLAGVTQSVVDLTARVLALETAVAPLDGRITDNATGVADLTNRMGAVESHSEANAKAIKAFADASVAAATAMQAQVSTIYGNPGDAPVL